MSTYRVYTPTRRTSSEDLLIASIEVVDSVVFHSFVLPLEHPFVLPFAAASSNPTPLPLFPSQPTPIDIVMCERLPSHIEVSTMILIVGRFFTMVLAASSQEVSGPPSTYTKYVANRKNRFDTCENKMYSSCALGSCV